MKEGFFAYRAGFIHIGMKDSPPLFDMRFGFFVGNVYRFDSMVFGFLFM